jgi:uncharacterized protein HemX
MATPGLLPALTEATKVKTDLKTLIGLGGALIAAAIWGTVVYLDVQGLKEAKAQQGHQLEEIQAQLSAMDRKVDRLTYALPIASRPSLYQPLGGNPPPTSVGP